MSVRHQRHYVQTPVREVSAPTDKQARRSWSPTYHKNSERPSDLNEPVAYDIDRQFVAATELLDRALSEPIQMAGYIEFN